MGMLLLLKELRNLMVKLVFEYRELIAWSELEENHA